MEATRQFGNRFLTDPEKVFDHNAWDDVEWDEEYERDATEKVQSNSQVVMQPQMIEQLNTDSGALWDKFYNIHQNRFFKDRQWLFKEFPELLYGASSDSGAGSGTQTASDTSVVNSCTGGSVTSTAWSATVKDPPNLSGVSDAVTGPFTQASKSQAEPCTTEAVTPAVDSNHDAVMSAVDSHPDAVMSAVDSHSDTVAPAVDSQGFVGCQASFRMFEVGCGVGNTIFPVLQTNIDSNMFVYGCDLSSTAIDILKEHYLYDTKRCHAFVGDVTKMDEPLPFPENSIDVITLIFILSAVSPESMQAAVSRLARCLKPGGLILFRDYGRYDLCQLRFKKGQCLSENFYARQDGTRVYFFTQDEVRAMFTRAGLSEVQNLVDRRLQVNRLRQIKMHRVWIQSKYRKPLA